MSKKGLSEIIAIVDRSGSMNSIREDAIGGFNTFLKGQKEAEGKANFTLVLFDNEYLTPYDNVPINEVEDLDNTTYVPRSTTALYDAIGRSINEAKARHENLADDEKPEQVIISILTDGHENASREFTQSQIKEMIEEQQNKHDWGFVFLAANQDATLAAQDMGISSNHAMSFAHSTRGAAKAYDAINNTVVAYRSGVDKHTVFTASMTTMTDEIDDQEASK